MLHLALLDRNFTWVCISTLEENRSCSADGIKPKVIFNMQTLVISQFSYALPLMESFKPHTHIQTNNNINLMVSVIRLMLRADAVYICSTQISTCQIEYWYELHVILVSPLHVIMWIKYKFLCLCFSSCSAGRFPCTQSTCTQKSNVSQ